MPVYSSMDKAQLSEEYKKLSEVYAGYKARGLSLNMARGKPGAEQISLSNDMFGVVTPKTNFTTEDCPDIRNYGNLYGIIEARRLFADILGVDAENVFVGGNSSLNLMFDTIACLMKQGAGGNFGITEYFGIEMITVPMIATGPDMDIVEKLVSEDDTIKGIWCVPKYSNPTGITYSDETVRRFAALRPAAKDFRIMWDNAYIIHDITDTPDQVLNIFDELKKTGNEDMVFEFCSTSKITFPGSGVAAVAASKSNLQLINNRYNYTTIGFDKINMLRHVLYFKNKDGVLEHMQQHRAILEPRFRMVVEMLDRELSGLEIAKWNNPNGGYFVSVDVEEGCAKKVVALCKEAGVILTGAGATFPYGNDPKDSNIRIAPTYPPVEELEIAMEVFCTAVKLAAAEKYLEK